MKRIEKYQKLGTRDKRKRMRLDKGQIEVIDDVMAEIYGIKHQPSVYILALKCGHQLKRYFSLIYAQQIHIGATNS